MDQFIPRRKLYIVYLISYLNVISAAYKSKCIGSSNNDDISCTIEDYNGDGFTELKIPKNYLDTSIKNIKFINSTVNKIAQTRIAYEFRHIHSIDLSQSSVKKLLPYNFKLLASLQSLNLSSNLITELPNSIFVGANNVENIDLSHNQIQTIEKGAFRKLKKSVCINLSFNQIAVLTPDTFSVIILTYLNLDFNLIEKFTVDKLTNIEKLSLNNNQLLSLELNSHIKYLSADNNYLQSKTLSVYDQNNLNSLSLKNNSFNNLYTFKNMSTLSYLDLSYNPLNNTNNSSEVLTNLKQLKSLFLKSVNLNEFNFVIFSELRDLEAFDISSNNLDSIDFDLLSRLENLKHLNLNNNNLNLLTFDKFEYLFPNLESIDISENEWHCTDLNKVLTKFKQLNIKVCFVSSTSRTLDTNINGIRCNNQSTLELQDTLNIDNKNIETSTVIIKVVVIIVVIFLIVSFGAYIALRTYKGKRQYTLVNK